MTITKPEVRLNYRITAASLGIPVGVAIAEITKLTPPKEPLDYILMVGLALGGMAADTVVYSLRKNPARISMHGGMENG